MAESHSWVQFVSLPLYEVEANEKSLQRLWNKTSGLNNQTRTMLWTTENREKLIMTIMENSHKDIKRVRKCFLVPAHANSARQYADFLHLIPL